MSVLFIMRSTFRNADARDCVGWKGIRSRASLLSSELSWLSRKLSQCIRYEKPLTASRIANHNHSCQQVTSACGKQLLHVVRRHASQKAFHLWSLFGQRFIPRRSVRNSGTRNRTSRHAESPRNASRNGRVGWELITWEVFLLETILS